MIAYIPITDSEFAVIDLDDFDKVAGWKWYKDRKGYAVNHKAQKMHHLIIGKREGFEVDHENRQKADNRKSNLRFVTASQNARNRRRLKDTVNPYAGVTKHKDKWRAYMHVEENGQKKNKYLGLYTTAEEAAKVRDAAVFVMFGTFAYFNFPIGDDNGKT